MDMEAKESGSHASLRVCVRDTGDVGLRLKAHVRIYRVGSKQPTAEGSESLSEATTEVRHSMTRDEDDCVEFHGLLPGQYRASATIGEYEVWSEDPSKADLKAGGSE